MTRAAWVRHCHAGAASPRRERVERPEPIHRLGRRRADRKGRAEAVRSGELIAEHDLLPDVLYTSLLRRAITHRAPRAGRRRPATGSRCAAAGGSTSATTARCRAWTRPDQGQNTARSSSCSGGAATTRRRRRSSRAASSARTPTRATPTSAAARSPSAWPTWWPGSCRTVTDVIVRDLRSGKTVLIVAHGNSLRALVKHLDQISDDEIAGLNIPTGIPLRYDLDADLRPVVAGRYLPRPRGRRRRCRRGRQPGRQVSLPAARQVDVRPR